MKKIAVFALSMLLLSSCEDLFIGVGMMGKFKNGQFSSSFDTESRYWPSYVMVLPEGTNLDDKKIEAIVIYNDYGVDKAQNPVGYNISLYKQNGISGSNTTLFSIEDKENESLYLEDANNKCLAYSIYNSDEDIYAYYLKSFEVDEPKLVAKGDADKLTSYASVVGEEIFWIESNGDEKKIYREGMEGDKEVLVSYDNAYMVMLDSYSDQYIAYYVENFDTAYNLINNEIVVFDVVANTELKIIDLEDNYELSSGNYDGVNAFYSAYDYGTEMYVYGKLLKNGSYVNYEEAENNDFTLTGSGNQIFLMKAMEGARSEYYEGRKIDVESKDEVTYNDLLNASFNNGYFFYVSCTINYDNLIDNISLNVYKAEE